MTFLYLNLLKPMKKGPPDLLEIGYIPHFSWDHKNSLTHLCKTMPGKPYTS